MIIFYRDLGVSIGQIVLSISNFWVGWTFEESATDRIN